MARTVSKYFNTVPSQQTGEQRLIEDLVIESIRINGMKIYYVPRDLVAADPILGEDPLSKFTRYFAVEAYFNTPENLGGSPMIGKLGFEMPRTAEFLVARRRFNEAVRYGNYTAMPNPQAQIAEVRPMDGDLIYVPMSGELFQISYADHEYVYYQLGRRYIWRLEVQKYDYSAETFATGQPDIDRVQERFDNQDSIVNDPLAENIEFHNEADINLDTIEPDLFGDPI